MGPCAEDEMAYVAVDLVRQEAIDAGRHVQRRPRVGEQERLERGEPECDRSQ